MPRCIVIGLIAAGLLAGCADRSPLGADPGMTWGLDHTEQEGAKLWFGVPETDNGLLMMMCRPKSGTVRVMVSTPSEQPTATLLLTSAGRSSRVAAELEPDLGEGASYVATLSADDPVLAAFARTGDLRFNAAGRETRLPPDKGQAQAFLASCRP